MSDPAIGVRGLVKWYTRAGHPPVRALDDVTFDVARGSIFGLLGPNGAGKTTLLRVLSTLSKPTGGQATVLGHDVAAAPLEVRRRISVVIQETAVELFLSVRDNLITFARFHGLRGSAIQPRVERVLSDFGLTSEAHRKAMDLSGGFRRRVQVAKIFLVDTPVVFLDEFSTGMDPLLKRSVMEKLRQEAGVQEAVVLHLADGLLVLRQFGDLLLHLDPGVGHVLGRAGIFLVGPARRLDRSSLVRIEREHDLVAAGAGRGGV